jgi:four helix bundle protein
MSEKISSFRDLKVYRAAFELQQEIFEITKTYPREEQYSLTDQIRRASRSIGANLSEGWQKRRYIAHFTSKLTDSDGEQAETQHWLDTSYACGYISLEEHEKLRSKCEEIGRMLGKMLKEPEKWCSRFMDK